MKTYIENIFSGNRINKKSFMILIALFLFPLLLYSCSSETTVNDSFSNLFYESSDLDINNNKIAPFAVDWNTIDTISIEGIISNGTPMYIGKIGSNIYPIIDEKNNYINGENPIVSPDQSKIAFIDFDQHKLHIVKNDQNFTTIKLIDSDVESVTWSSDSNSLVWIEINLIESTRSLQILQYDIMSDKIFTLYEYTDDNFFYSAEVSLSPDQEKIAVSIIKKDNNNIKKIPNVSDIYIVSLGEQEIDQLELNFISRNRFPIWYSDTVVFFIAEKISNSRVGSADIIIYDVNDSCYSILENYKQFRGISLSADKSQIVYLQGTSIFVANVKDFLSGNLISSPICINNKSE